MTAIIAKIQTLSTAALREMALTLNNDMSDEAGIVLNAILAALEVRMDEVKFLAFCEQMEG